MVYIYLSQAINIVGSLKIISYMVKGIFNGKMEILIKATFKIISFMDMEYTQENKPTMSTEDITWRVKNMDEDK